MNFEEKAAAEPPIECQIGNDTPRVNALIAKVMADYPAHTASAEARYYDEVHQHLAPMARGLERETVLLRALARDALQAWDDSKDARVGKLLRAMLDEKFLKVYRPDLVPSRENLPELQTCTKSQTPIDWGRVEQAESLGVAVHVTPAINEKCKHEWDEPAGRSPERCTKCGLSFLRYIHSCCP